MTKLKSKKMTKSTFAIIIMAVVMVAMLAFGGTYAYFTAQANSVESANLNTGYVRLTTTATPATIFTKDDILPGDSIVATDVVYSVATTDTAGNYVAVKITMTSEATGLVEGIMGAAEFGIGDEWTLIGTVSNGVATYYQKVAKSDNATATVAAADFKVPVTFGDNAPEIQGQTPSAVMEKAITVKIEARSIQVSYVPEGTLEATLKGLFA